MLRELYRIRVSRVCLVYRGRRSGGWPTPYRHEKSYLNERARQRAAPEGHPSRSFGRRASFQGATHGEKARAENSVRADPTSKRHQPRFGRTPTFEKRKAARAAPGRTTLQRRARKRRACSRYEKSIQPRCRTQHPMAQSHPGRKNAQRKSSGVETSLDTDKTKLWGRSGVSMRARRRTKINMPPELSCTPSMPRVSSGFTRVLFRQGLRPSARHSAGSKSRPRDAAANAREAPSIGETGQ